MAEPLDILKFNLQEKQYPYFSDDELALLLENNDDDVKRASYQGCIMKAAADDSLEVSGVKLESNREYWLTLAKQFKQLQYNNSMQRADGQ